MLTVGSFGVAVLGMVIGSIWLGWGTYHYVTLFTCLMLLCCIIHGMSPNQICEHFVSSAMVGLFGCFIIGMSRGVLVVLEEGNIVDSIIYYLSLPLSKLPTWLGAEALMVVQQLINFLIPSGSGQATAVMPIMVPLADMLGITRQTAVLAFQFGDGISNTFWFTNGTLLIYLGLAKVPLKSWYKFILPLHGLFAILQVVFLFIALEIGYGPM